MSVVCVLLAYKGSCTPLAMPVDHAYPMGFLLMYTTGLIIIILLLYNYYNYSYTHKGCQQTCYTQCHMTLNSVLDVDVVCTKQSSTTSTYYRLMIIELVDSNGRNGPDSYVYVIHYKNLIVKFNNSTNKIL